MEPLTPGGPQSLSPADRARRRRSIAVVLGAGLALFVASSLLTYFLPIPARPIPLPSALSPPRLPFAAACPSGLTCPPSEDVEAQGRARYFDDGLPPSPAPAALSQSAHGAPKPP
jgi:hypothetical protein